MKLQNYKVLLNELVSVNSKDQVIGPISKWDAHLNSYILKENALPHRAFSIFLFNSKNQLFLQRRSSSKKTFPLCWTNTCCSHPNMIQYEGCETKSVEDIRASLHRALDRELKMDLTKESFYLVDKILYKAEGRDNEEYGEYELDYVYLIKLKQPTVHFEIVPDEIAETTWITKDELLSFVTREQKQERLHFSPWFMKMYKSGLVNKWWDMAAQNELRNLGSEENLDITSL